MATDSSAVYTFLDTEIQQELQEERIIMRKSGERGDLLDERSPSKSFKVIIVGGSIAELSLALMLEKNGIDFLMLEGYPSIATQVGASLALLPNGLVIEMAEHSVDKVFFLDSKGKPFWSSENFNQQITGRFYHSPRIQILYDNIQDKSKILTSQRVPTVQNSPSHVTIVTKAGQSHMGDIVVGADEIQITVRQQMWKEAGKTDPLWTDPSEENTLPATYACIFGISEGVPGIERGTLSSVYNEYFSYLIPRFSQEKEEALAKERWGDYITPMVRFSDLYKHKTNSVYTSLSEYVYKRCYLQKIMTIGDSCHKFEPLTGEGGNSAIETAAALMNHLMAALMRARSHSLSTADVSSVFGKVQGQREEHVWSLVKTSHTRQPVSLDMVPIPRRSRDIPFHDELFRVPATRGFLGLLLCAGYLLIAFVAFRLLFVAAAANGTWSLVHVAVRGQSLTIGETKVPIRQLYPRFQPVCKVLQSLVTIFFPALLYSLASMLPLISIFTVEGYRPRDKWSFLSSPSLWAILYQLHGIGLIAPFYFMASTFLPLGYHSTAKAILPAVAVGYILPPMLLFLPVEDAQTYQAIVAAWQPAPIFAVLLTGVFSWTIRWIHQARQAKATPASTDEDLAPRSCPSAYSLRNYRHYIRCWVSISDLYRVGISKVSPLTAFAGGLVVGFFGIGPDATAAAVEFQQRC
ncbi:hypothetical protein BDV29DRAFT_196997 [Aspergillus leporis]|uniref:FAD-binding domain-containing protein n=1 Tax=Aspergillus leporis TaxID=41062 RepID=A0A5N5WYA9_9EURO|nr:hypothetical protein BDV29DRAFT_196997 [Aspergillus leporis]